VAKLLVSVRSAIEARAALAGGAAIIDVKEPSRGSLGMAACSVWRQVREAVPLSVIVSVALGELNDWLGPVRVELPPDCWEGIAFRKLGLADARPCWAEGWNELRESMIRKGMDPADPKSGRPGWVTVVYLDWETARAPHPTSVIDAASEMSDCPGILFDTWDKSRPPAFDSKVRRWIGRAKEIGRFVALAGSLDEAAIQRLRPLGPDIFAVRGAACRGGDRTAPIDTERVARLIEAAGR
jgi:(5-formylfuran-3-yl)methyl phosphate synthase